MDETKRDSLGRKGSLWENDTDRMEELGPKNGVQRLNASVLEFSKS